MLVALMPRSSQTRPRPRSNQAESLLTQIALQSATLDDRELIAKMLPAIVTSLSADVGAAYLPDGEGLVLAAHHGLPAEALEGPSGGVVLDHCPVQKAFTEREPVIFYVDPPSNVGQVVACVAVPMAVRDEASGAFLVCRANPPRFSPGELELMVGIGAQLGIASQLAATRRQLVWKERLAALGELSAVLAHEVRNPLGVIFNALSSLRRLVAPVPAVTTLLDILSEEADRLNRMIGDLLDFARPSTPSLRPEPIEPLIDEVLATAVPDPSAKKLEIHRSFMEALPRISMDPRLLRQALLNLVQNAVQAMPRGGTLEIKAMAETSPHSQGTRWVRVEISDTGNGISEALRPRIFQPFFTTKAAGTGLGLAVVQRIIEDHGGSVTVSSERGKGATFVVRLPATGVAKSPSTS